MPTSYTKETKPSTSYTKESKPQGAGSPAGFDISTFDSGTFDDAGGGGTTSYTKETKPNTSYTKESKP